MSGDLQQNGKTRLVQHQICWLYGVPPWLVMDYEPTFRERVVWWFRARWVDWRSR